MIAYLKSAIGECGITNVAQNKIFETKIFTTALNIDSDLWNEVVPKNNLFLSINYLKSIESVLPIGIKPFYIICLKKNIPIFVAYFQNYTFSKNHLDFITNKDAIIKCTDKIKQNLNKVLFQYLNNTKKNILILGNILQTGISCYIAKNNSELEDCLKTSINEIKKQNPFIALVLKDIELNNNNKGLINNSFISIPTQPNMLLNVDSKWDTINDYTNKLLPKYKKRWNNTFNKNENITKREFSFDDIIFYNKEIYSLYLNVYYNSSTKINPVDLNYFINLKKSLPSNFYVIGYFLNEQLVAFASYFININILETNYIGYETTMNKDYKLYLTILYDYIEIAILKNCKQISYSRTGLEIKSTVGAIQQEMDCKIRITNKIINKLAMPFIKNIENFTFKQHQPFKNEN